jgi:hypothetical protein
MKRLIGRLALAAALLFVARAGWAQTADEVIERALTALGGRAALGKLTTQSAAGTITLSTPGGPVSGPVEILSALPNKSRTLINLDLSALGAGQLVLDQRFDGSSGYIMDSLQGNRDIKGNQLDNMRNGSFPSLLLNYKKAGATVMLGAKEKVGDRDAYLLIFEFPAGSLVRQYIDAETWLTLKVVVKIDVPELGREIEQTNELSDYRKVGDVKVAFEFRSFSEIQSLTIKLDRVEHNVAVDPKLFVKPPTP